MEISEQSVVDADLLAIEEINKSGGVLGKQIEAIVEDGTTNYLIGSGAFATLFKSVTPLYDFFTFFATTSMAKVMLFALILIFLQYKPAGIFPQKGRSVEL
jgi:urea transport system permease protein